MSKSNRKFRLFERKMKTENLPDIVIENFKFYYDRLAGGETGLIPETKIRPVEALADIQAQPTDELARIGAENLHKAVIIKLNGGLGTSMGMQKAKSLLKVKGDYSFLDLIVRQARCLKRPVPVIFMNSFSTQRDTSEALKAYPDLKKKNIPWASCSTKFPKWMRTVCFPLIVRRIRNLTGAPRGTGIFIRPCRPAAC